MAASLSSHASWTLCPAASSTSCICLCEESLAISEFLRLAESRAISLSCRDAATAAKPAPAACLVVCPAAVHSGQGPAARCGRMAATSWRVSTERGLCCEMKFCAVNSEYEDFEYEGSRRVYTHTPSHVRLTAASQSHVFARGRDTRKLAQGMSDSRGARSHRPQASDASIVRAACDEEGATHRPDP